MICDRCKGTGLIILPQGAPDLEEGEGEGEGGGSRHTPTMIGGEVS